MHEIGFFQGKYGFENVVILHEEGVSIPSNIHGLVYVAFSKGNIDSTFSLAKGIKSYFSLEDTADNPVKPVDRNAGERVAASIPPNPISQSLRPSGDLPHTPIPDSP